MYHPRCLPPRHQSLPSHPCSRGNKTQSAPFSAMVGASCLPISQEPEQICTSSTEAARCGYQQWRQTRRLDTAGHCTGQQNVCPFSAKDRQLVMHHWLHKYANKSSEKHLRSLQDTLRLTVSKFNHKTRGNCPFSCLNGLPFLFLLLKETAISPP